MTNSKDTAKNLPPETIDDFFVLEASLYRNKWVNFNVMRNSGGWEVDPDGTIEGFAIDRTVSSMGREVVFNDPLMLSLGHGWVKYKLVKSVTGIDTFQYVIKDDDGATAIGNVTIKIVIPGYEIGTPDDDIMSFNGHKNLEIRGLAGNDIIRNFIDNDESVNGGAGDDTIRGRKTDDILNGDGGNDKIFSYAGDDIIDGGNGHDLIKSGAGDDVINGGRGNDTIKSGAGADTIYVHSGKDVVKAGSGDDKIYVTSSSSKIYGGAGDDYISLGGLGGHDVGANNEIYGGGGSDTLKGGNKSEYIHGGNGDDYIETRDGKDVVNGGNGDDRIMLWGSGHKTVIFTNFKDFKNGHSDTVSFFNKSNGTIDISDLLSGYNAKKDEISDFVNIKGEYQGAYLYVDADGSGKKHGMELIAHITGVNARMTTAHLEDYIDKGIMIV